MVSLLLLHTAHRTIFHHCAVRTSTTCYGRFILAMRRSLGFASTPRHRSRPVRTRFPCGSVPEALNLWRRKVTRRPMLQKVRRHTGRRIRRVHSAPTACRYKVSGSFHFPTGILFIGSSRYLFTIGHQRVLSLGRWSSRIHAGFHVSDATWGMALVAFRLSHTGLSPSVAGLSSPVPIGFPLTASAAPQPRARRRRARFGLIPVRSPLLRESRLISLPPGTEMFQFPGFASGPYGFRTG